MPGRFSDHAYWRAHLGTADEARYPTINVEMANPNIASDPQLTHALMAVNVGDRMTIDNLPAFVPPSRLGIVSQIVQGWREIISAFAHDIEFNCTPETPWRVGVWDTDRYDTAGSQLAVDAAQGAGTLSVTTTLGPRWTTNTGDVPFDIEVAGIRVTVLGVLGTGATQTFVVDSATVTKALPSGAEVRLADPAIRAL